MLTNLKTEQKQESRDTLQKNQADKTAAEMNRAGVFDGMTGTAFDDLGARYNSDRPAQLREWGDVRGGAFRRICQIGYGSVYTAPWQKVRQQKRYINEMPITNNLQPEENTKKIALKKRETANSSVVVQMGGFDELYNNLFGKPAKGTQIPRIIHRFWAGGMMSAQTMQNIIEMQLKINAHNEHSGKSSKEGAWKQILWTNTKINKSVGNAIEKQLEYLIAIGVNIADSDDLATNIISRDLNSDDKYSKGHEQRIDNSMEDLMKLKNTSYIPLKFYSDTVRLMAVYKYGGIYMDTDIGPGTIDLTQSLYHRDVDSVIPLAGAQVQNSATYAKMQKEDKCSMDFVSKFINAKGFFSSIHPIFSKAKTKRPPEMSEKSFYLFLNTFHDYESSEPVYNYFFASKAKNPRFKLAIEHMLINPCESGMNEMTRLFQSTKGFSEWVIPWITELEWATTASDVQEGDLVEKPEESFSLNKIPLARPMPLVTQHLQVDGVDYSYNPQEIAGDGNCFFNAVIAATDSTILTQQAMRIAAAASQSHTNGIENDGIWAEREDVLSIANHFNLHIYIHFFNDFGEEYLVEEFGPINGAEVRLVLAHRHYSPLRMTHLE